MNRIIQREFVIFRSFVFYNRGTLGITNILYIGGYLENMTTIIRVINRQMDWDGVGVQNEE